MEFTLRQQEVLDARGHNILVSAAAGSGKTAVLVERIIRMISEGEHPLDIDRLLVVTFTRAAAAQMRERIGKAISRRLEECPQDRHLQRQETLLHRAQISTIDSFCTALLRDNFSEIGLDPGFRQMDETESQLLGAEVLHRFLEEQYAMAASCGGGTQPDENGAAGGGPAFSACVDYYCPGGNDAALEELILKLCRAADSHPYPDVWLEERRQDYAVESVQELQSCDWYRHLLLERLETVRELQRQYEELLRMAEEPGGPYPWLGFLTQEGASLFRWTGRLRAADRRGEEAGALSAGYDGQDAGNALTADEDTEWRAGGAVGPASGEELEDLRQNLVRMSRFSFGRLPGITKKADKERVDPDRRQRTRKLRDQIKKQVRLISDGIEETPECTVQRMRQAAGPLNTLIDLTLGYRKALREAKREKNAVDFSDVEHYALDVLIDRSADGTLTLRPAAAAQRSYYDEVLIDEYQDSNEVQELLLSAITGEAGTGFVMQEGPAGRYARFMVGDVKQSIYRFRNARPEIFQHKFDTYRRKDSCTERIDLDQNFRSRTEVLDAANGICGKVMRREIGGVEYDETVSLKPGAAYPEPEPDGNGLDPYQTELLVVDCASSGTGSEGGGRDSSAGRKASEVPGSGESRAQSSAGTEDSGAEEGESSEQDEVALLSASRKEALAAAQRIRQLVGVLPITDPETGTQRPARYGDIVILLRSAATRQDAFREIFEKEGIPLYMDYKGGYFAAEEVRQVLQLLRVIDNPRQDIPLYGVLRGYFGGFTLDEIGMIRAGQQEKDSLLFDALLAAAGAVPVPSADRNTGSAATGGDQDCGGRSAVPAREEGAAAAPGADRPGPEGQDPQTDPALREKCAAFLQRLAGYRELASTMPIHELIGHLIRSTGYEDYVRALPAGQRRAANLHALLVKAAAFEQTDYAGLFQFLRYIDQMHAADVDYDEAGVLDEHADVVRLTTIHKSKGLEYPICFVCGLGSRYPYIKDLSGTLLTDADLGVGVSYVDSRLRCSIPTIRQKAVASRMEKDALGEELRILYVAMTRAQEKLILMGSFRDAGRRLSDIEDAMAGAEFPARHLSKSMILSRDGYLPLILKAVHALRAEGREPIRVEVIPVTDLQLAQLEDQMTQHALRQTLLLMEERAPEQLPDPEMARRLEERFSWQYPHGNLAGLYTKTTVTELKRAAMTGDGLYGEPGGMPAELYPDEEYIDGVSGESVGRDPESEESDGPDRRKPERKEQDALPVPRFALESPEPSAEGRLRGPARGTAVHRICELIDYREWPQPDRVTAAQFLGKMNSLLAAGEIPPSYAEIARPGIFLPFLRSGIASRMARAEGRGQLRREQPFVMGLPANRMNEAFPSGETVLIQGIMDAFFPEGEGEQRGIVLVDYKTDRVRTGAELAQRYHVQMEYYAQALERMLRLPVKEKILYSFSLQEEIRI